MRSTLFLAFGTAFGNVWCQPTLVNSSGTTLSIRVQPMAKMEDRRRLWDTLETAAPSKLMVDEGETIESALKYKCGAVPTDLRQKLIELNPGLDLGVTSDQRQLNFISCPFWYFGQNLTTNPTQRLPPSIPVRKGEDLKSLLQHFMGTAGTKTIADVARLNPGVAAMGEDSIQQNGRLTLPYIAKPLRVNLSEDQLQAPSIIAMISDGVPAKKRAIVRANLSETEYQLVAAADPEISDPKVQCGAPESLGESWPVNLSRVEEAIRITRLLAPPTFQTSVASNVAIADTGLLLDEQVLSKRLWINRRIVGGMVSTSSIFTEDRNGASMVLRRGRDVDISAPSDYQYSRHGSDVARVVVESGVRQAALDGMVEVSILKLNDLQAPYAIRLEAVPTALDYARAIQASVINLSVVTGGQAALLDTAIAASYGLVVVAAGNDRDFPESLGIFPPSLANNRHKMIVVGAHDWRGGLASFSNKGDLVDMAAPGCAIPLRHPDTGEIRLVSGTSFAAPFVSSLAGMLVSVGFEADPPLMRSRILGAGRFEPALMNVTKYGVRLDVPRTIRYREDSYLPKGAAEPVYGKVRPQQNFICTTAAGKKSFLPLQVIKIIANKNGRPSVWTHPRSAGPLQVSDCKDDFVRTSFTFRASGAEAWEEVNWTDVEDVVMSFTPNAP